VPSLDLRFADNKSLVDAVSGQNLVTFTRASRGTFVGSDGVLRTAVTNLLLRSEEFDNASWTKVRATVSANTIAAPNGTLSADTGIEDASASTTHNPLIQDATIIANGTYTASLYVKTKERSRGDIWFSSTDSANYVAGSFNLGTGTISASNAGTGSGAVASIANVGDGWYRVSVTGSIGSSLTTGRLVLRLADGTGSIVYTGDGTSGIYLWGAQLEQSSTAGEYIPTTSVINSAPRFDHNPLTGESLGLLVEEQRTNLLTYSEDISQWASAFNATQTLNNITAPNVTSTADRLLETATTNLHTNDGVALTFVTSTAYTYSVFVKPIGDRNFEIAFPVTVFTARFARFTLTGLGSVQGSDSGVTASIQALPNGWYRCVATSTCASGSSSRMGNFINDSTNSRSYAGDTAKGIYIWGAQLEAGAFPTSYIPTTTAAVTRSADVISITGSAFSSGTVYVEHFANQIPSAVQVFGINNGTATDRSFSPYINGRNYIFDIVTSGVSQASIATQDNSIPLLATSKGAFAASNSGASVSANGLTAVTDSSVTLPTTSTEMQIGRYVPAGAFLCSTIRRLTYWPQRLPDSTLQNITQ
jgi:hypothetical protein